MDYFKCFAALSIFLLVYILLTRTNNSVDDEICRTVRSFYKKWNKCITKELSTFRKDSSALWNSIGDASDACERETTMGHLQITMYPNKDENKYHILPDGKQDFSVIVTIGIGMDVSAEEKLKQDLPGTAVFVGSDPVTENAKVYEPIGQYYPFAVSGRSGLSTASVLMNGTYQNDNAVHVDLVYFLKEVIEPSVSLFDDLWIDAEGGEYSMMPVFYKGGKLDQHNLTICQFNMEVHSPSEVQKKKFRDFINRILGDGRYVFLRMTSAAGHWRMFFLNFDSTECSKKYLVRVKST